MGAGGGLRQHRRSGMRRLWNLLFAAPLDRDPDALRSARREMKKCAAYYAQGWDRSGLSFVQNSAIDDYLDRAVAFVSGKYLAEGGDIEGWRKVAVSELGGQIRASHGYYPVAKSFREYLQKMPVVLLLNAEALAKLHAETEVPRELYTRFEPEKANRLMPMAKQYVREMGVEDGLPQFFADMRSGKVV